MPALLNLPFELFINILGRLSGRDILKCKETCKYLQCIVDSSMELQYKIDLYSNNLINRPSTNLNTATRLRLLHDYQQAWSELRWANTHFIEPPPQAFANSCQWRVRDSILAIRYGQSFKFTQIPSSTKGIQCQQWDIEDVDVECCDFDIDPAQNLLVTVQKTSSYASGSQFNLHIRSMNHIHTHLHPTPNILSYNPNVQDPIESHSVRIFGKYLVFMLNRPRSPAYSLRRLVVWDWTSGELLKTFIGHIHDYAFTHDSHLVLCVLREKTRGLNYTLSLDVADLDGPANPDGQLVNKYDGIKASLSYPSISSAGSIHNFTLTTDSTSCPSHPFATAPNDRILVNMGDSIAHSGWSFISSVNVRFISTVVSALQPGEPCKVVEWETWGPSNGSTRMVDLPAGSKCSIHGLKALVKMGEDIHVYDFNDRARLRSEAIQHPEANYSYHPTVYATYAKHHIPVNPYWSTFMRAGLDTVFHFRDRRLKPPAEYIPEDHDDVALTDDAILIFKNNAIAILSF